MFRAFLDFFLHCYCSFKFQAKIIPMLEHYLSLVPADILAATEKKLESEFGKEKVHVAEEIKRLKEVDLENSFLSNLLLK